MGYDLQTAIALGADQLANQFAIIFPDGVPGGGDAESLALRMDQDFDPPQVMVGTYEYFFQGLKIIRTSAVEGTDKRYNLIFRLDQNWEVSNTLELWHNLVHDKEKGTFKDDSETRTTMVFQAFGPDKTPVKQIIFEGALIIAYKLTAFGHQIEEPTRVECEFIFHKMNSVI